LAPTSRTTTFLRYWLPLLAYVALIFILSSMPRLRPPVAFLNVDKVVHMGEYMVLGWLTGRALHTVPAFGGLAASGLAAIALGAVVGCADEFYQSTVPGREASVLDWAADFLGVTLSQVAYAWFKRPRTTRVAARAGTGEV
jgi:VanZ family protein